MKNINIPCEKIQRVRVKMITEKNCVEDEPLKFDIKNDMSRLKDVLKSNSSYIGFLMEASYYKENMYIKGNLGMCEFGPLKYYFVGKRQGDFYWFCEQKYCKLPYIEIVEDEQKLREALANVILSAEESPDLEAFVSLYSDVISHRSKVL